ncbi:MAG: hypothetical protein WAK78_01370 [Candidatus Acidiferrales bacterium]
MAIERDAMRGGELKYPEWQAALQELTRESDARILQEKLQRVEMLILERMQNLFPSSDGGGEHAALLDALETLRIIKREKLGFPDWS